MMVQPIPTGYHDITPYLIVRNAAAAIDFYKKALNAVELMRFPGPGGKIMHAEVKIGDSPVMLAEEMPEEGYVGPQTLGGAGVSMMLYVEDVDTRFAQAIAAGATIKRPVQDQFYGDRTGTLVDPFGHVWSIGTHKEDVSMEELQRRMAKLGQS
ncbi:MAG TPA: VOC family protein [Casimicrobiaceae bacterium]|nr:VOC family protein [Casimicrobiaceae bacterium]